VKSELGLAPNQPARRRWAWACSLLLVLSAGCQKRDLRPPAAAQPGARAPIPPRGKQITLIYSSNLLAEYEQCGCPVHPMGGLARRATQIDRARAESDAILVLDAGDLFLPLAARAKSGPPPVADEIERRGRLLAGAYARMGTTAFLPGERDLALGLPVLRRLANTGAAGLPLVASNLYGRDGKLLFAADRLIEAAGIKIGIFAVAAPPTPEDETAWRAAGIQAKDPVETARAEVASLRGRGAALVVALLHLGREPEHRKLLAAVPGVDWAVMGHSAMRHETPEEAGGARMLEAMINGKELGRLDLHVVDGRVAFVDGGQRGQVETILADHRRQLVEHDQRLRETSDATMRALFENRRREIDKAIAREEELLRLLPATIAGSWFENRLLPLDASTPDQTGVGLLVHAYNQESVRRAAAGKPVGVGTAPHGAPAQAAKSAGDHDAASPDYLGSDACGACHAPALAFWKTTKHARALAALARAGRDRDPACVGCHVTGYLQPGGTNDIAVARGRLANVGCEACHGAGRAHVEATVKKGSAEKAVAESVCLGCHTRDQTNGEFEYPTFLQAILGPGHGKPPIASVPH
jgi:hypothetical protein